ncbi:DinF Protein [Spironucleus salmonicida]|uniref:DinF Protein n=1 Tax=Spironucleus salmonicida TaxID=348837 RepID=V6LFK2_9EUKA|nr:DinF Protein [Spironucleus salmonicida]|eukprot:EST43272.1 DinF Protein [Spironucleus salmonicida]
MDFGDDMASAHGGSSSYSAGSSMRSLAKDDMQTMISLPIHQLFFAAVPIASLGLILESMVPFFEISLLWWFKGIPATTLYCVLQPIFKLCSNVIPNASYFMGSVMINQSLMKNQRRAASIYLTYCVVWSAFLSLIIAAIFVIFYENFMNLFAPRLLNYDPLAVKILFIANPITQTFGSALTQIMEINFDDAILSMMRCFFVAFHILIYYLLFFIEKTIDKDFHYMLYAAGKVIADSLEMLAIFSIFTKRHLPPAVSVVAKFKMSNMSPFRLNLIVSILKIFPIYLVYYGMPVIVQILIYLFFALRQYNDVNFSDFARTGFAVYLFYMSLSDQMNVAMSTFLQGFIRAHLTLQRKDRIYQMLLFAGIGTFIMSFVWGAGLYLTAGIFVHMMLPNGGMGASEIYDERGTLFDLAKNGALYGAFNSFFHIIVSIANQEECQEKWAGVLPFVLVMFILPVSTIMSAVIQYFRIEGNVNYLLDYMFGGFCQAIFSIGLWVGYVMRYKKEISTDVEKGDQEEEIEEEVEDDEELVQKQNQSHSALLGESNIASKRGSSNEKDEQNHFVDE